MELKIAYICLCHKVSSGTPELLDEIDKHIL